MSLDWVQEANEKAKKASEEGKALLNDDGIKTDAQDPSFLYDYPWLNHDPNDKVKKCSVSTFTVNSYCREVLTYLKDNDDLSDRKRLQRIVERALIEEAKRIESNQTK